MARALFLGIFVYLFAVVCAAPAQSALNPADLINLLGIGIVSDIRVTITLDTLVTNLVSINFDVKNPLPVELTISEITSSASLNGTEYASFSHTFPKPGLVVPILGTKNSGTIANVLLTQGAEASLEIIPDGILDLTSDASVRAATIFGQLGIPLALDGLKQSSVPTSYNLTLS